MTAMILELDPPLWHKTYPFESTQYVINDDETVMAMVTEDGAVKLLRTSDLKVLAIRRINASPSLGMPYIELRFITMKNEKKSSGTDILVVFVYDSNIPPTDTETEVLVPSGRASFIIVSGIDGGLLNSLDKNTYSRASMALKVSNFEISDHLPFQGQKVNLGGCFLQETMVRILVVTCPHGLVTAYDFDVTSCQLSTETQTLELNSIPVFHQQMGSLKWIAECKLDFTFHDPWALFTLAAECDDWKGIFWFDVKSLQMVGEYYIQKKKEDKNFNIISCLAVVAINQQCVAAVVVFRRDVGIVLETIQATLAFTDSLNRASAISDVYGSFSAEKALKISNFHTVFRIGLANDDPNRADIRAIQLKRSFIHDPFRFRFWFIQTSTPYFREFTPGDDASIGKFRLLLALKSYDDAEALIEETGSLSSSFGSMHVSEIALHNFKSLLADGDPKSKASMERAKHLLRRLAHGAVSGGQIGVESLIAAAVALYNLPEENTIQAKLFTSRGYRLALVAMSSTFQSALQGVSRSYAKRLEDQKKIINEKIDALNCLDMFPELLQECEDYSWIAIKSSKDLFRVLISRGNLPAALRLKDLDCCRGLIDTETMVMTIVQIKPSVDPEVYVQWVGDVLLQMNLTDPLVSIILNWAHRMADAMDEDNNHGIDASLVLLSSIKAVLVKMFGRIHNSFASILKRESVATSTSSNPAVMRVNFIRGYGDKKIDSLVSKRLRNYNSEQKKNDVEDEDYFSLIETKLFIAQALKEARLIGLRNEQIKLTQLHKTNGSTILAQYLLIHFFNKADFDPIKRDVQSFCAKFHVDFDQVIVFCVKELCDGKAKYFHKLPHIVTLAQYTTNPDSICDLALRICRMASLSDETPECVFFFANEAMNLALNEGTRSELKEALRLLLINDIIRRYCGLSSRELFNVSDIRHASRLLDFVCSFVSSPVVLTDALALCDAFTHLSKSDACINILQGTLLNIINTDTPFLSFEKSKDQLVDLIHRMNIMEQTEFIESPNQSLDYAASSKRRFTSSTEKKVRFIPSIINRICLFCSELLEELKPRLQVATQLTTIIRVKSMMKTLCSSAICILKAALESILNEELISSYDTLLRSFRRLERLQEEYDLFISLSDLKNQGLVQGLIEKMLSEHDDLLKVDSLRSNIFKAKRLCNLFFTGLHESSSLFFSLVGDFAAKKLIKDDVDPFALFLFLGECDLSRQTNIAATTPIFMQFAISICQSVVLDIRHSHKADCFGNINRGQILNTIKKCLCAAHILKESTILLCSAQLLPVAMHLLGATEIISYAFQQFDSRIGEIAISYNHLVKKGLLADCISVCTDKSSKINMISSSIPVLKPSWYADDGLLLPPYDALKYSVEFLSSALPFSAVKSRSRVPDVDKMAGLFFSRGALTLTFRLLTFTSAFASEDGVVGEFDDMLQQIIQQLAERSLGTAGGGIISGEIDSQLAMAYILILPPTMALKVLNSSLPSSMSRRDFVRLLKLTSVGLRACGQRSIYDDHELIKKTENVRWGHEFSFISKALDLASKARWWSILQRLELDFDPDIFNSPGCSSNLTNWSDQNSDDGYSKMINAFVARTFLILKTPSTVHCLMDDYSKSFGIDIVTLIQIFIEYLLSGPSTRHKPVKETTDTTIDLKVCETAVKYMLDLVPSHGQRTCIVRKCLMMMEANDDSGADYERYNLILSIYSAELSHLLSFHENQQSSATDHVAELLQVRQRKETLNILASYFHGNKLRFRPILHKFFKPLGECHSSSAVIDTNISHVLGSTESSNSTDFDPLIQIANYFRETHDYSSVSALAPICVPLSLPTGAVHVRSLIERIKRAKEIGNKPLSFKNEVEPVINRLKSTKDASVLAEWCAAQYPEDSTERLECLDLAETLAFNAAKDLEFGVNGDVALERFKRMRGEKSALSDTLSVQEILTEQNRPSTFIYPVDMMLGAVNRVAHDLHQDSKLIPPEILVENLLVSGAQMVAEASLSDTTIFTPDDFRSVASLVHKACGLLQNQHSHIDLSYICKKVTTRWIIHADSELKSDQGIKRFYESREDSEFKDAASGLKIAFVLSFCESFHQKHRIDDLTNKESQRHLTRTAHENRIPHVKNRAIESRESELAMNHARFLLKIAFEKSTGLIVNDVLTFAMRHRALRAARILCPEDVLLIILHQDLGLSVDGVDAGTLLQKCCFGCFVAKEVESMGLNLPSSDLISLSMMDYASFARMLWRQYGRVDLNLRNRFLLLLLDLARSDESSMDTEFVSTLERELDSVKIKI